MGFATKKFLLVLAVMVLEKCNGHELSKHPPPGFKQHGLEIFSEAHGGGGHDLGISSVVGDVVVTGEVSGFLGGVALGVTQLLEGVKDALGNIHNSLKNFGAIFIATSGNIAHTFIETFKAFPPLILKYLSFLPIVGDSFRRLKEKTIDCNLRTDEAALKEALSALGHCISTPWDEISEDIGQIIVAFQKVLNEINRSLNEALKARGLMESLGKLANGFPILLKKIFAIFRSIVHPLGTVLKNLPKFFKCAAMKVVLQYVKTMTGNSKEFIGCYFRAIAS